MLKGRNEFTLNEATIIQAVQEYLDRRRAPEFPPDTVESVKPYRGHIGYDERFVVTVQSAEETPDAR